MKNLTIKLSDKDHDLLQRIAQATDRRLSDLCYLLFARGLDSFFCEDLVSVPMHDDEMPQDLRDQIAKNSELEQQEGWHELDWKEKEKQGHKYVCRYMNNAHNQPGGDQLIEPLAKRIAAEATK